MATIDTTYTDRLSRYAATLHYSQLPAEAIDGAKIVVLDSIGAMLAGSLPRFGGSRYTGDLVKKLGGVPECTVIGRGFKTNVANAALANATMGAAADSEGGWVGRQHIAAVLVPVILALGEREHADGKTLISALALGYDVAACIDAAADPKTPYPHSFDPSAVFGHFAAAAATGHFLRLEQEQWANALGLAGINAGGLIAWVNDPTDDSRAYGIGMAARCGVIAAMLAKMGMAGPLGIVDKNRYSMYDAFSGDMEPALEEASRTLGEVFAIARSQGFTRHAQELDEKFFSLATMRITRDAAERVKAICDDLEALDDAARLAELLAISEERV
jgi:2-methylcitrate dehydratase PrpD